MRRTGTTPLASKAALRSGRIEGSDTAICPPKVARPLSAGTFGDRTRGMVQFTAPHAR